MTIEYMGNEVYKLEFFDGQIVTLNSDQLATIKQYDFHNNKVGVSCEDLEIKIERLNIEIDRMKEVAIEIKRLADF